MIKPISEFAYDMLKRSISHYNLTHGSPLHIYTRFAKPTTLPAVEELVANGLIDVVFEQDVETYLAKGKIGSRFLLWLMANPKIIRFYRANIKGMKYFIEHAEMMDRVNSGLSGLDFAKQYVYLDQVKEKSKKE